MNEIDAKKNNENENLSRTGSVKNVLHEPVAPYFASVYNTLISIVQGFALAGLYVQISEQTITPALIGESIVAILTIGIIWHRYVMHSQYVSWRLDMWDVIIPLGFTFTQYLLISSIDANVNNEDGHTFDFAIVFMVTSGWSFVAYLNSFLKYRGASSIQALELFEEHFRDEDKNFSQDLIGELKEYHKMRLYTIGIITIFFVLVAVLAHHLSINEEIKNIAVCSIFTFALILLFFKYDLRWKLNNCKRKTIQKYKW